MPRDSEYPTLNTIRLCYDDSIERRKVASEANCGRFARQLSTRADGQGCWVLGVGQPGTFPNGCRPLALGSRSQSPHAEAWGYQRKALRAAPLRRTRGMGLQRRP